MVAADKMLYGDFMEDVMKAVKESDILIVLIASKDYSGSMKRLSKSVAVVSKNVCYVSVNKPYKTILGELESGGVNADRFFFVDCIGKGPDGQNVMHVSSPKALTEINIILNKALDKTKAKCVLLDSLSTLMIYNDPSIVTKFAHSIISMLRNAGAKAVFVCIKGSVKSEVIDDLSMFVDKVVEMQ